MQLKLKTISPRCFAVWVVFAAITPWFGGCGPHNSATAKKLTGGVNVTHETEATVLASGPSKIYIQDFSLDVSDLKTDSGIGGLADQVSGSGGLLGRLSQRTGRGSISGSAEAQAPQIISAMSESLVTAFKKRGVPAQRLTQGIGALVSDGWLVKGRFVGIDEGNRAQRAALGFGLGATQMEVRVDVSDLTSKDLDQSIMNFETTKEAGMKPGGFNPYVIAAKFHMERKATLEDIQKTAEEIVAEILKTPRRTKASK